MRKMKKPLSVLLVILMILTSVPLSGLVGVELPDLFSFKAKAESVTGGYLTSGYCGDKSTGGDGKNISWVLDENGVLTITGMGKMAREAFNYDLRIKEAIISDGITNIPDYCFNACSNLSKITIGDDVKTIGSFAFAWCSGLTSIDLPESLTTIGSDAFYYCSGLTSIDLPESLTTIGSSAFSWCSGLTSIDLPDSLITIGSSAFSWCSKLETVTIGAGVTGIGEYAFSNCSKLYSIEVSENNGSYSSVDGVLYNKAQTELIFVPNAISGEITIPTTVEDFTYTAVDNCKGLTGINVATGNVNYKSVDGIVYTADGKTLVVCPRGKQGAVTVADGTETIGSYAFYYCSGLTSIDLPESLTTIDSMAFHYCYGLTSIDLPESLTTIGSSAFSWCSGLTSIDLPESLTTIGSHAFSLCSKLKTVTIGAGVTGIGEYAFDNCSKLYSIEVSENNGSYSSVDGVLYNKAQTKLIFVPNAISGEITIPATVEDFTYTAVSSCDGLTGINVATGNVNYKSVDGIVYTADGKTLVVCPRGKQSAVTVADGTETIGSYAFYYCSGLTSIDLPESLTTIDSMAFHYCYGLTSIDLPESLTTIGSSAFSWCSGLTSINIPKAITKINNSMFSYCGFIELTLPETVQSFDHTGWSKLKTFTIENRYCEYTSTDAPQFGSDTTIRAYCGSPGHTLAVKRLLNFESLGHTFLDWYVFQPATYKADGIERRDCAYCGGYEERIIPKLESDVYTATFVADGEIVATVDFPKGATEIAEPTVPAKDRYLGEWEKYTLNDADITINAIYTLIKSDDASEVETESTVTHYTDKDDILFKLRAWADAKVVKSTVSKSVPLDIILVVDQSGSMDDTLGSNRKKVDVLKETAKDFVNTVYDNAIKTDADHRISIVGFGSSSTSSGTKNENTELLTSANGIIQFNNIKSTDYGSSLISVNDNGKVNNALITAINNIDAKGATSADLGFEMAKGVFANTDSEGRQRVVIFMTDGQPTYTNTFSTSVANAAIANASLLKTAYDASIYSVGIFSDEDRRSTKVNSFMNAVTSGYPDAASMSYLGKGVDGEYYLTVDSTDALASVFKTISTEALSHTAPFDDITFVKTLSDKVTFTSRQEEQLRVDLIRKYGITNDDIIVTRNDDGTTTIQINGLTPYETVDENGKVIYEVSVEFFASLNENASAAGDYVVDTDDSGVMLGSDAKGYEATFDTSTITLNAKKTRVIFTINGEVYEVSEQISNGYPVAPKIEVADDWFFTGWDTTQKATNGLVLDATLTKVKRTITWHTADGDIVQTYFMGEIITAPTVGKNSEGNIFLSWDRSVPTTMPDENLEFTAIYGEHVHNYISEVTKKMTCVTDGIRTFTCFCGDSYTETIEAIGHNYQAITPSIDNNEAICTFVCENCGDKYEYALDYEVVESTGNKTRILYEFSLTDDNLNTNIQPDGSIQIKIPLSELHGSAEKVTVTRTNEDGTKTQVPAVHEKGFLIITCDHFTPYEVIFDIPCEKHVPGEWNVITPATCKDDGVRQTVCTECEKTYDEVIPATGHSPAELVEENFVAPNCTENGSKDVVVYCSVCNEEISRETVTLDAAGHNYNAVATAPDCINGGYTTYTCSVCEDSYTGDEVNALGHTPSAAAEENYVAPNCTENGSKDLVIYCSVCEEEINRETVVINPTGHNYTTIVTVPTCNAQGYTTYTCECGDTYVDDYVDALGHVPANAVEENCVAPTCTENGSKDIVVYCSVCSEEISRETVTLNATGHADNDGDGYCDADNELLDTSVECNHSCHKEGITGFFWRIINVINMLFGLNKTCDCGVAHY